MHCSITCQSPAPASLIPSPLGCRALTCTCRRLQCDSAIIHGSPLLRDLGCRALPQIDVRHIFPAALGPRVHAQCRISELDLGRVRLDVPLLLWFVGDSLPVQCGISKAP